MPRPHPTPFKSRSDPPPHPGAAPSEARREATPTLNIATWAMVWAMALSLCLSACWGVTGHRARLSPAQTLGWALEAHHRGDDRAFRTLLTRIVDVAPESEEAAVARTLLMSVPLADQRLLLPLPDHTLSSPDAPTEPSSTPVDDPPPITD